MGAVHFSLDVNLVRALHSVLSLEKLVETGTFQGDTVARMLDHFGEILSVERSAELCNQARARFRRHAHVHCANESSPPWLSRLRPTLADQSVLYWLDAHWCNAADTAGQDAQCPLLEELDAIGSLNDASVVLIDDARLFLSRPSYLHKCEQWPRLQPLLDRLRRLSSRHEIDVVNDVIVFAPGIARPALDAYCRDYSVDWADVMETSRQQSLALDGLTGQVARLTEDHRALSRQSQAKSRLIAELDARCLEMAKPSYPFKVLCRRLARLFGSCAPAPQPIEAPRRAA